MIIIIGIIITHLTWLATPVRSCLVHCQLSVALGCAVCLFSARPLGRHAHARRPLSCARMSALMINDKCCWNYQAKTISKFNRRSIENQFENQLKTKVENKWKFHQERWNKYICSNTKNVFERLKKISALKMIQKIVEWIDLSDVSMKYFLKYPWPKFWFFRSLFLSARGSGSSSSEENPFFSCPGCFSRSLVFPVDKTYFSFCFWN